jgi:hypothetical protein
LRAPQETSSPAGAPHDPKFMTLNSRENTTPLTDILGTPTTPQPGHPPYPFWRTGQLDVQSTTGQAQFTFSVPSATPHLNVFNATSHSFVPEPSHYSTSFLPGIGHDFHQIASTSATPLPPIPPLRVSTTPSTVKDGVHGYAPHKGPSNCKITIYIRPTSPLGLKILQKESRFWLDFAGTKSALVPHTYYFPPAFATAYPALGRERLVLLGLVPPKYTLGRMVGMKILVEGMNGRRQLGVEMGGFEYDESGILIWRGG